MTRAAMSRSTERSVLARSLLLQSCWNQERMQNLGFCLAIEPWLRRLYSGKRERLEALSRHQAYFNTNPYMAPLTLGMVCALEREAAGAAGEERQARFRRIAALKVAAGGALAGIGDALFWGALRPACAAAASLTGLVLWRFGARAAPFAMAAVYLLFFNAATAATRCRGLRLGLEWGEDIAARMKALPWQGWIRKTRRAGGMLAGALLAAALLWAPARLRLEGMAGFLAYTIAARVTGAAASPARFYAACCALGGLAALAGWWR